MAQFCEVSTLMAHFIRFVVHQRVAGDPRRVGLFTAAYHLRGEGDLTRRDHTRLHELLSWFETELTVPSSDTIPARAIFWYQDVGSFSGPMWQLARFLEHYGFTTELITARFVGRVVYQDRYQVAAMPTRRRRR